MTQKWIKNWFSNFEPFDQPFFYFGDYYNTPENFFQAMKTLDKTQRKAIAALSPSQAKKMGRAVQLREDWEQKKLEVMEYVLRYKFAPGTSWHTKLVATGDEEIVEVNNWHDNIWGACICDKCKNKPKYNHLGKILMKLREEFKSVSNN